MKQGHYQDLGSTYPLREQPAGGQGVGVLSLFLLCSLVWRRAPLTPSHPKGKL